MQTKYIKIRRSLLIINMIIMIGLLVVLFTTTIFASGTKAGRIDEENSSSKTAYVFIGDSRTVGMDRSVDLTHKKDTFVVAKSGMGYNWFMKEGSELLYNIRENHKDEYDKWIYIFNLGVNDLSNVNNYIDLYRELSDEATVYYLSINPTDDSVGGIQCKDIKKFNSDIYRETYNNYINSYQYLKDVSGFSFDKRKDGMHYDDSTYEKLYDFILEAVSVRQFVEKNNSRYSAFYYLYNVR